MSRKVRIYLNGASKYTVTVGDVEITVEAVGPGSGPNFAVEESNGTAEAGLEKKPEAAAAGGPAVRPAHPKVSGTWAAEKTMEEEPSGEDRRGGPRNGY